RSWSAAVDELAGGVERTAEALRAFAGVQRSSRIDPRRAPELTALIEEFRHTGKAGPLHRALAAVHDAPRVLREGLENRAFLTETAPWLDATEAWGRAALGALDMLSAQRAGRGAEAWAARQSLPALVEWANSSVWTGPDPGREVPVELDPVLAEFVEDSLVENTRWLGLAQPAAITNLPLLDGCFPVSHMTDGDPATYFWGAAAPAPGHFAGIDLGRPRPVTCVEVQMGSSDSPDDFIHEGVLEYSCDGATWTEGEAFTGETTVKVDLPAGTVARFVRLRVTKAQDNWVVVREFTVRRGDVLTVSGTPPPTGGSDFALAADEDPGTAYEAAASASAGDAILAELPSARELRKVLVLQPGTETAGGEVQIRTPEGWTTLGPLSGTGFTELPARGIEADAVRLRWAPGSRPPAVSEILPVYAGDAPVSVGFTPSTVALETSDRAVLTAVLTSTRCEDQRLSVRTHPPKGITLTPARGDVPLPRGARAELPLEIRASADAAPGTHHIPVTVHGNHGTPPARATLSVTVWPG
ncbi:discoidin domain-containing protein, partial [Streptomyces sp. NPDC005408]|uniref:discoidin domain-containing protein n=1 Tax=Streptomyces sp. NPDC005408 TaxID=3155341 RepID=UPI0033A2026F